MKTDNTFMDELSADEPSNTLPSNEALEQLGKMAIQATTLEGEITSVEKILKAKKAALAKLLEADIPQLMQEFGLADIRTTDGARIQIDESWHASVTGPKKPFVIQWLLDHNHGDIVKSSVTVQFDKGQDEVAGSLMAGLVENGFTPTRAQDVHTGSLKSLVRELVDEGEDVPLEELGVYRRTVAKITK